VQSTRRAPPPIAREGVMRFVRHNLTQPEITHLHRMTSAEALSPDHRAHHFLIERWRLGVELLRQSMTWKAHPGAAARTGLGEMGWLPKPNLDQLAVRESFCRRFFV
jgi:hypothetical protein